jgi:pimeloyl-ACP methyl ester carboxylesterase
VLLVQGCGVIGNGWRPQVDGLADRYELFTFDNPGIGDSELNGTLSVEAMAADALAIVDAERVERFHLAGHSLGGLVAQQVALAAPQRVKSLALLCSFARGAQGARMSLSMLLTAIRMRIGTRPMRRQAFLELVMPASYLATVNGADLAGRLAPLFGRDLAENPSIMMKQVRAMSRFDAAARLGALSTIPTLVVSAEHDRIARPSYGRELAAAIPGSRYVEIPGAGHGVTMQCRDAINALLAEHLAAAEQAPSPA